MDENKGGINQRGGINSRISVDSFTDIVRRFDGFPGHVERFSSVLSKTIARFRP